MLDVASAKAAAARLGPHQFTTLRGDIERLDSVLPPEAAGSFNLITLSAAAPFLRRPARALAAWRAWLRRGGRIALNAYASPALEEHALFVSLARAAGAADETDPCEPLGDAARLRAALEAAGYSGVQVGRRAGGAACCCGCVLPVRRLREGTTWQ